MLIPIWIYCDWTMHLDCQIHWYSTLGAPPPHFSGLRIQEQYSSFGLPRKASVYFLGSLATVAAVTFKAKKDMQIKKQHLSHLWTGTTKKKKINASNQISTDQHYHLHLFWYICIEQWANTPQFLVEPRMVIQFIHKELFPIVQNQSPKSVRSTKHIKHSCL